MRNKVQILLYCILTVALSGGTSRQRNSSAQPQVSTVTIAESGAVDVDLWLLVGEGGRGQ